MQQTEPATATRLLSLPLEIKANGPSGTFEGYGAIFGNKDRDGDIVARGAFAESLKSGMPALLWQHDQKAPIGRLDEVREDDKGLYVKGKLVMQGRGLEAYELLKMGALNGLSIGFVTKEASRDPATRTRTISKADLMEISLVTFPANELARVSTVKTAFSNNEEPEMFETPASDARSFERMLRENGFSRSRAKTITAKGFKAVDLGADETAEIAEMVAEIKARQKAIEKKGFVEKFELFAPPIVWGPWWRLKTVASHPTERSSFKMSFASQADAPGPFEVQVEFVSRRGKQRKTLFSPSSEEFDLALNSWQEPRVRARSRTVNGQILRVIKHGS